MMKACDDTDCQAYDGAGPSDRADKILARREIARTAMRIIARK